MSNPWAEWWKGEAITRDVNWQKNIKIFVKSTQPVMQYSKDDVILDIGSGPCFLARYLKDEVKEIHCLDISEAYLNVGNAACKGSRNVFFYKLDETSYTQFPFLKEKKITKIICQSVIQYYRDKTEVNDMIAEVKRVAAPGAKLVISDLMDKANALSQVAGLLRTSVREKYFWESLKLIYRHRFSDYHQVRANNKLLALSDEELYEILTNLGLNGEILRRQFTINSNRKHLLVQF